MMFSGMLMFLVTSNAPASRSSKSHFTVTLGEYFTNSTSTKSVRREIYHSGITVRVQLCHRKDLLTTLDGQKPTLTATVSLVHLPPERPDTEENPPETGLTPDVTVDGNDMAKESNPSFCISASMV